MKDKIRSSRIRLAVIIVVVIAVVAGIVGRFSIEPALTPSKYRSLSKTEATLASNDIFKEVFSEVFGDTNVSDAEEEAIEDEDGKEDEEKKDEKNSDSNSDEKMEEEKPTGGLIATIIPEATQKPNKDTSEQKPSKDDKNNASSDKTDDKNAASQNITVYISINCHAAIGNIEDPAVAAAVPESGVILGRTSYTCAPGTNVYDVLSAVCRSNGIQLDASYSPAYGSYYVEGINYLYEFHGGPYSGWTYTVGGSRPNVGASSYGLNGGEEIVWSYTVTG